MEEDPADECPVCFRTLHDTIRTTPPCGHTVCLQCLLRLRQRACPLCRADLRRHFASEEEEESAEGEGATTSPLATNPLLAAYGNAPASFISRLLRQPPSTNTDVESLLALAAQPPSTPPRPLPITSLLRPVVVTHDAAET
tara:strand:+ start:595 stop:1017 length:423 start_codon:yes stop_codon:yes gene_type:complete